ncbi:MAG: WecB/TagA/CpsF family glycosyltransferase [Candidatus Micrarchaeia archaeon]
MIRFCGLNFKGLTRDIIFSKEPQTQLKIIVTCNAEFIVKAQRNKRFAEIINNNIATFDGQVPYILAKLLNPGVKIEKISGYDLIYDFCKYAKMNKKRIFLLGGYPDSNTISVNKLRKEYQIEIDGYSPPYEDYPFSNGNNSKILEKIESFKPHILFVGFGAVKQEFWIEDNKEFLKKIGVEFAIGCGGAFEMISGKFKRAPIVIQKLCMEGLWRLLLEPRWFRVKRLLLSLMIFRYILRK